MNLGIIQGRLLPPVGDKIQEFPESDWQIEFDKISELNLKHIEFIVTEKSFSNFKNLNLSKYSRYISGICCDNLIDVNFSKLSFLEKNLEPICEIAIRDGISNINIPLLEESKINDGNILEFSNNILKISSRYKQLNFNFEIESPIDTSLYIVNLSENYFFIYDTGNLNYIGVDHNEYINKLIKKTSIFHLKDRDINGSHFPGEGKTNFRLIFSLIKNNNFDGYFTIQTKRGKTGEESQTILNHMRYFKTLWENKSINHI